MERKSSVKSEKYAHQLCETAELDGELSLLLFKVDFFYF